jgi:hypothetical protein
MGYFVEGLELFVRKVAYTKYDATVLVRWSNYSSISKSNWPDINSLSSVWVFCLHVDCL